MAENDDASKSPVRPGTPVLALAAAAALALVMALYWQAISGGIVADDVIYLENPALRAPGASGLADIWNPAGSAASYTVNFAPVHLSLHWLTHKIFGASVPAHHVVNIVVHWLASLALVAYLLRLGHPFAVATAAAVLFLVHPANVEAVAWASQLKSTAALAFALAALSLFPQRAGLATALFVCALLSKAAAAAALPVAAVTVWCEAQHLTPPQRAHAWRMVALWALIFLPYAVVEFAAFGGGNAAVRTLGEGLWERGWNVLAVAGRYLAMSFTSYGLAAFQQPPAVSGPLNPWSLLGLCGVAIGAWRFCVAVARREAPEAAAWAFVAAGFAPVSQVLPFKFPVADRYLYFMLPGLLAALAVWVPRHKLRDANFLRFAAAACAVLVLACGVRTSERARLWSNAAFVMADSVRHSPEGLTAQTRRARNAAASGDATAAVAALRAAMEVGFEGMSQLLSDPAFGPIRGDARFVAVIDDLARDWVGRFEAKRRPSQLDLKSLAHAYTVLDRRDDAKRALERALALGGPQDDEIRERLQQIERLR